MKTTAWTLHTLFLAAGMTLCFGRLVPDAHAATSAQLELWQRQAVEEATPEEPGRRGAAAIFSNLSFGRVGHASWSLLVPGWSQYRAGHNRRALVFASLEAAVWTMWGVSTLQGHSREDTYQDFARDFAGVAGSADNDSYWTAVGKYKTSEEYNEQVRRENRAAAEEQEINGEPVTIGIDDNTIGSADGWAWTSGTRLLQFRDLRGDAQSAYDRADAMIFFAVINRLVSFVEALRSGPGEIADNQVRLYERAGFELSVEMDPNPLRPAGALSVGRSF